MPLIRKKSVLAAKIEGTPGTAEVLAASEGLFNIYDAQVPPNIQMTAREGQGAFSKLTSVIGTQSGNCTFSTDLTMNSSAPSWVTTFLPACGLKLTSTTYNCITEAPGTNAKTLTMGLYIDGIVYRIRGACGTFTAEFMAGQKIRLNFTFNGVWDGFETKTLLLPTYPSHEAMRWASSTTTIGGGDIAASAMTFDLGNQITLLESQATAEGYKHAFIADRQPTLTIDPETDFAGTPNSLDRYAAWLSGTPVAIAWNATNADNGEWEFSLPAAQIINQQPGERSGVLTEQLNFEAKRSSALNDEFSMTYTLNS